MLDSEKRLTENFTLEAVPAFCDGGNKGNWIEAEDPAHLEAARGLGLEIPDTIDDGNRFMVLVLDGHPRAGILMPPELGRDHQDLPLNGKVFVNSPIDEAWTYQAALRSLMLALGQSEASADNLVDYIVQNDMEQDDAPGM